MKRSVGCVLLVLAFVGCGDDGGGDDTSTGGDTSIGGDTGTGGDTGPVSDSSIGDTSTGDTGPTTDSSTGDTGPSTDSGTPGGPTMLPSSTGTCPDFVDGTVSFNPSAIAARDVRIWVSDAATALDGPLVIFWHGTGGNPSRATFGIGRSVIDEILALGGIVAAPTHDTAAGTYPWFLVSGTREDDLLLADEIVACANETVGIDTRRIHTLGMSAGGLMTTQMSYRRSGYLASVVSFSGGLGPRGAPARQDPSNVFPALIFHGGPTDVFVLDFQDTSEAYWTELDGAGHFAGICNHGGGHSYPGEQDSVWQFFQDHPWGTTPSPYAGGFPAGFASSCSLMP